MKNKIYLLVALISSFFISASNSFAEMEFGLGKIDPKIKGVDKSLHIAAQDLVATSLKFLGILAVIYGIYGGFLMMNSQGKDDGMKKGKSIITNVIIGLVVMFLANAIIQFVIMNIIGVQK